jgi:hypothetical protein
MNGASTSDSPAMTGPTPKKESRKPRYSKFTQQELPACKPLLTPGWVITTFMVVGIVFIPIGIVCLLASNSVVEIVHRYDNDPRCVGNAATKEAKVNFIQDNTTNKACTVTLTVPKKMNSPVYIYYQLDDFYQNHRRYVKDYDASQLRSNSPITDTSGPSDCKPEATYNGKAIFPCGLIAWSLFNDTYAFQTGGSNLTVNRNDISWKSDRDDKFGSALPSNFLNSILVGTENTSLIGGKALDLTKPLNQDEDLIVWMRTAALPTFRKLWGKIEQDLVVNQTIAVTIQNNYNTYTFSGKKRLVMSTTSWLGGKNNFLGIAYLTVGILCILLAFIFFIIHLKNPRPLGDPSYLSWNRKTPAVANSSG